MITLAHYIIYSENLDGNIQCKKNIQNEKSLHELIDGQGQGTFDDGKSS